MSERTYSEEEMAALLERAAELQAHTARTNERSTGLTLAELEAIAEEAGLSAEHLRQAAGEMEKLGPSLLGKSTSTTATHIHVEQWVPGALTPEASEEVVAYLRSRFDSDLGSMMGGGVYGTGTVEQVGRSLEWKHLSMWGIETRVQMRPKGERVHVRIGQRVALGSNRAEGIGYGLAAAALLAPIAGAIAGSVLIGSIAFVLLAMIAIPAITYYDRVWRQKKHRELEELTERVTTLIATHQETQQTQTSVATPVAGRVALPAEEEVDESVPVAQRARTRST